ncbi:MAG: ribulose-phosphate 3-epimerase, partial [Actinomycetes bacterium]
IVKFADAGASIISIHPEATRHLDRSIQLIKEKGCMAGVVLNPATPLNAIRHVLDRVDLILLMSVNPGFGGQSYIPTVEPKIAELRAMIEASGHDVDLEVDGGIGPSTIGGAVAAGANVFVAGNAVFRHADGLAPAIAGLRDAAAAARA